MISITASSDPTYLENNAQPMVLYDNLLQGGTVTNASLPTTGPRSNAYDESTNSVWVTQGSRDTLQVSYGSTGVVADCAFFARHNLAGTSVKVQYFGSGIWNDWATYTPANNDPFLMIFPERTSVGWGVDVAGSKYVGVVMIGKRLVIPGGVVPEYTPAWGAKQVDRFPNISRRGHYLGQKLERAGLRLSAEFMPIEVNYVISDMLTFADAYNNGRPFVWASAPSVFPEDVAYCWADNGQTFAPRILAGGNLCRLSLSMQGYAEV